MKNNFIKPALRMLMLLGVFITSLFAASSVQAASQAWTNAPADNTWTNINNWVGKAVPGAVNSTTTADVATFTNAIPLSGIGGAGNPISNDFTRGVFGFVFDATNCGAYVFGNSLTDNWLEIMASGTTIGYTTIGAAVTNPITFKTSFRTKLQSSQNGRYDFTNNATSPNASLFIAAITNSSANTRPMEIHLSGSNTGTNTVGLFDDQLGGSGAYLIIKEGTGKWILSGPNDLPQKTSAGVVATVQVNNGTLEVKDPASLGSITAANLFVQTNGILQIDNVTPNNAGITLRNGGTIRMNGSGTINSLIAGNAAATSATLATTSASDVMTVGTVANTPSGGAADTVLHVAGPGTVLLNQNATYIGRWSVDAGTNQLANAAALGTGANINLAAGSVFDITLLGATTYALGTKALSANGTGTAIGTTAAAINADPAAIIDFGSKPVALTFTPASFTGDSGHPALLISQGTASFNGNSITVSNASGTALGAGNYQLVHQNSGSITSSGGFVTLVTGSGLGSGLIAEIVASGGNLNLVVSAYTPKSLVWTGGDAVNPTTWDRLVSANWLAGAVHTTFNIYDSVTFNSVGSSNPIVTLASVMAPGSVVVDTVSNDYTFTGVGQVAGGTSLVKINPGTLTLGTINTYSGGTIVSNGVIKLGVDEAISSTGGGDVSVNGSGKIDLNNFTNTIGALNGNGTVDNTGGGTSTLLLGNNGNSGTFTGVIQNTSGTMSLAKSGTGTETLTSSNSYGGTTVIDTGTLRTTNLNALGSSAVTINNGTLDLATSLSVASIGGNGGTIVNVSTPTTVTNTLIVQGASTSGSVIGGRVAVLVNAGTLRLNAANTYSGGTIIASGAGLAFGAGTANAGTGIIIASNNVTIRQANTGSSSSAPGNTISTVDGATVTLTSGTTANTWGGQFLGSALATNIFSGGAMSMSGVNEFSNFLGTVIITNGTVRMGSGTGPFGGDNTAFNFVNGGGMFTRDAATIRLGLLSGNGRIDNPSVAPFGTYWIGAKGLDSIFSGNISGSNNIVKTGAGKLTLNGATVTLNPYSNNNQTFTTNIVDNGDGTFTTNVVDNGDQTYSTNFLYASSLINYVGNTTVSNGVMALVAPNTITNSPIIALATSAAVLDATQMGYVSNLLSIDDGVTPTNSFLVTNGVFTLNSGQLLTGVGVLKASNMFSFGTINPGNGSGNGTLSISNSLTINAGATNTFDLSDDLTGLVKPYDKINVLGNVTLAGASTITINGVLTPGVYRLVKYTGNLINESGVVPSGPISNFTLAGLNQTSRATMVLSNAPGEVDLVVVSLNNLNLGWTGDGISNWWDVATSYDWTNGATSIQFFQFDNVNFNDSTTNYSVLIQGVVTPTTITVNNSVTNYTFGGPGSIGGSAILIKNGSASLIITNLGNNTYSGGTILSNGVLSVGTDSGGNQNDFALGTGPVTVNGTSELRFGGNTGGVVRHFITNSISVNGGTVKAQDGEQHLTNSAVSVTANGASLQTVFSTKNLVLDSPLVGSGPVTIGVPAGAAGGTVVFNNPTNTISGAIIITTNGVLTLNGLAGVSNSPSIDIQLGGAIDTAGRTNRLLTVVNGQTLKGNGTVRGNLTTAAGSTLSPGAATSTLGALNVANGTGPTNTTATLSGTTIMELNRASNPNSDRLQTTGTNVFGGTLTVNNIGAALQANDSFLLFTNLATRGTFALTNLPALPAGLAWSNSIVLNGRITVIATVNTNAFTLTNTLSGNVLTLSWPADHTGYRLQAQTNALTTGLSTNWVTVPGSTSVNSTNFTINPANGAVFYRLIYP